MEGRCSVETLTEFGYSSASSVLRVGSDVFLCTGGDEVYVFTYQNRDLKAILIFPGPVRDLHVNEDNQTLHVACCSGVYCVCLSSLSSRVESSEASSTASHVKVSSKHLVIKEDGVLALLLVNSVLVNLRLTNTSWLLTRSKTSQDSILGSYETLASLKLPLLSDLEHQSEKRPLLLCVHSADSPSSSSLPSGHVKLEADLFKLIFGTDAALAKSPVVFCALPDGRLCFASHSLPGSHLKVLHSLEEPVVFVGASAGTRTDPAGCLVALGERGKVVLVTSKPGGGAGAAFTEACVPGPVLCACLEKQRLYYSTGSDLLVLDLSLASKEEWAAAPRNVISLNVCQVVALAEHARNVEGKVELLGISCRGRLQAIRLPGGLQDGGSSHLPSSHASRSIRDVLSAIGDVYERASVLKASIKSRNQTLKHLNHVLNVSFLLHDGANDGTPAPARDKRIRCHATTSWSALLQEDSLNLNCVLENASSYDLSLGWTLNISVSSMCQSAKGESRSTYYSFPFQNLQSGKKLDISLPLAPAGDSWLPYLVSCSLTLSPSALLGEEAVAAAPRDALISLPLNTLVVDWLHALRVLTRNTATRLHHATPSDTVRAFLKSRRAQEAHATNGQHSTSVKVSAQLLRDVLKPADGDVCVALLDWLLCQSHGGVKMKGDKMAANCSTVHARAINGHVVKMTAKEDELAEEEPLAVVELEIESSSLAAVCGIHHAVLRRVQIMLQKAPENSSTIRMQTLRVREALQCAHKMLQQLQQSQTSCNFEEGVSTGKAAATTTSRLLSVYEQLRGTENSLLIL